jgi:hypothetical protein
VAFPGYGSTPGEAWARDPPVSMESML